MSNVVTTLLYVYSLAVQGPLSLPLSWNYSLSQSRAQLYLLWHI